MQTFYDYNPVSPFVPPVQPETHTVSPQGTIRLHYIPKKGTVSISGFTEKQDSNVGLTEFYINYQDTTDYRTAQGYVFFSPSQAGTSVLVNYTGVSTIIWADAMNEIKGHMEDTSKHLGDITADPTTSTAYSLTGSVAQFFSWITKRFEEATGVSWGTTIVASLKKLWQLPWTEKFILFNPADLYVSPGIPLSRNGTMITMDFYVTGAPTAATVVTVKQNGVALSPTVSLSSAGKTTLTFGTAVTGTADDLLSFSVTGGGLSACTVVANGKWVNR